MSASKFSLDQAQASIGREIGVSDWLAIGQDRVFEFARVTEDFQFIHVDPEKAAATAFGGTIAHGFLALSLLSTMFQKAIGHIEGSGVAMNYGFELCASSPPCTPVGASAPASPSRTVPSASPDSGG